MTQPLVTMILPAYNHEAYIGDNFASLIAQTYQNVEVIIADDGSKDKSYEVILSWKERLEERFQKVTILKNEENLGLIRTLNKMLPLRSGTYVKILATDDMLLPDSIENMVDFWIANPQYSVLHSNGIIVPEETHFPIECTETYKRFHAEPPIHNKQALAQLYRGNFINAPSAMVRSEVYEMIGVYDESIGIEDWEYWLRVASSGLQIGYVAEETVAYRNAHTGMSHFARDEAGKRRFLYIIENELKILEKYYPVVEKNCASVYTDFLFDRLAMSIDREVPIAVTYLFQYAKERQLPVPFRLKLKYLLYQLHILKIVQSVKRKLGIETFVELNFED